MSRFLVKLFVILLLFSQSSNALELKLVSYQDMPPGTYEIDNTHASLLWQVSHLGLSDYTARFTDFDATIELNPKEPEKSTVTASINSASVKTDYPYPEKKDFDKKLQGKKWFNSKKFPEITFKSTKIDFTQDDSAIMVGDLTFLGITKEIKMNVTLIGAMHKQPISKKATIGFKATTNIKRSDWEMTSYLPNIGDEVKIMFNGEFAMKDFDLSSTFNR